MNRRENFLNMYRRKGYKYAPVDLDFCPALQKKYGQEAGDKEMEEYFDYPEGFATETLPGLRINRSEAPDWKKYYSETFKAGTGFGPYGVAREPGDDMESHFRIMHHPMASINTLEEMKEYPFPEYYDDITHIEEAVKQAHSHDKAAYGKMACTIWETAWYIRDMSLLMMDMTDNDPKAGYLLDKITEHSCKRAAAFSKAGADIIQLGDDVGMQSSIMMSKDMYRTWLKPRLAKVIKSAKEQNPDVLIFYHTCGYVEPLINDLIEAGIEILNPVQPECMDFAEIHQKYGHRISFSGTIGTQTTMPFGSPEEVKEKVFRNLKIAGEKGGLLCCPSHKLEPEVPWENIIAYVNACKEFSVKHL
jgi:uroporphyrinogen decarboxylase